MSHSFPVYFAGGPSPTTFSARDYIAGLQMLLDRHEVAAMVVGLEQQRDFEKFKERPVVEFSIESFRGSSTGALRELDGTLTGNLLVMVRMVDALAEAYAFELALDVATALVDEVDYEDPAAAPVHMAGPISVTSIEPAQPDGAFQHRVASYLITYEQDMRIRRVAPMPEPVPLKTLFVGRDPDIGPEHLDDYRQVAPPPEE